jgi:hypothetical protein
MTDRAVPASVRTPATGLKAHLLRAGLLGLCAGLTIIGLMENANRFSTPETLRAPWSQSERPVDLRADRLDVAIHVDDDAPITCAKASSAGVWQPGKHVLFRIGNNLVFYFQLGYIVAGVHPCRALKRHAFRAINPAKRQRPPGHKPLI